MAQQNFTPRLHIEKPQHSLISDIAQPVIIYKKQNNPPPQPQGIVVSLQKHTPETLSGGQLVEIYRQKLKKLKEMKVEGLQGFIPLEQSDIPAQLVLPDKDIKTKLDSFFKMVEEEKENEVKLKRKMEKELEEQNKMEIKPKDRGNKQREDAYPENIAMVEMGITADGQAIQTGSQYGLGYNENRTDEIYARFRQKQSYQYHQTAEERQFQREKTDICYKCNQPGHIAKDCKYGLS